MLGERGDDEAAAPVDRRSLELLFGEMAQRRLHGDVVVGEPRPQPVDGECCGRCKDAVSPVEPARRERVRVGTLHLTHLHEQLPEAGVAAGKAIGEVLFGEQTERQVPHEMVGADLLGEQRVHPPDSAARFIPCASSDR